MTTGRYTEIFALSLFFLFCVFGFFKEEGAPRQKAVNNAESVSEQMVQYRRHSMFPTPIRSGIYRDELCTAQGVRSASQDLGFPPFCFNLQEANLLAWEVLIQNVIKPLYRNSYDLSKLAWLEQA